MALGVQLVFEQATACSHPSLLTLAYAVGPEQDFSHAEALSSLPLLSELALSSTLDVAKLIVATALAFKVLQKAFVSAKVQEVGMVQVLEVISPS